MKEFIKKITSDFNKGIDKSKLMNGPWTNEPDVFVFESDEAVGFPCLILRNENMFHLCGYVVLNCEQYEQLSEEEIYGLDCHGGVTYNGKLDRFCNDGEVTGMFAIGFDCWHYDDISPYAITKLGVKCYKKYKNIDFVKEECKKLAIQINAILSEKTIEILD